MCLCVCFSSDVIVVKGEGSLDVEDTALKIRHRRLTAEKKPPPDRQPKGDSVQDNKHSASVEQVAELHAEEEDKGAEIDVETDGTMKDADEEGENEVIQSHKEEMKVSGYLYKFKHILPQLNALSVNE